MRADRPPTTEALHSGPPTPPRPAATVLVVRDRAEGMQVLLVRRNPAARFMGGFWVFPGGGVDPADGTDEPGRRRAAVREVREETGVALPDPGALLLLSRWITPKAFQRRFDTAFYLAKLPPGERVSIDGQECVDFAWLAAADALGRHADGHLPLVLPTIMHLQDLSHSGSVNDACARARGRHVELIEPRVVHSGGLPHVVLPGYPEYD